MKTYPEYDDIEKCEDEPIAFYPKLQQHGCVLILDDQLVVKQASSNTKDIISCSPNELLGVNINTIFNKEVFDHLVNWNSNLADYQFLKANCKENMVAIIPQKTTNGFLLDIEPMDTSWDSDLYRQKLLKSFKQFSSTRNLQELLEEAAVQIKQLFKFDRVMIYSFDENWNGQIVSEAKENQLESWLGLRYPAGDIPKNARDLFKSQGVRSLSNISEVYADMVPMLHPDTQKLTDIGKSHLRGSSRYHIEYLTNMGVAATLNCAIIHNNKLWGLIACHHYSPKTTSYLKMQSCHLMAEMFSSQISLKVSNETFGNMERMSSVRNQLIEQINTSEDIVSGLTQFKITGKSLIECSDFAVGFNNIIQTVSKKLTNELILRLVLELSQEFSDKECITHENVVSICPWLIDHVKDVAGVVLFKLSPGFTNDFMLWLRPEKLKEVTWGGDPTIHKQQEGQNLRLSPRKSFDKWVEQVKHTSKPWLTSEISILKSLVDDVKNIIITRFTQVVQLNKQLSNLNEELESFSYSVSHDLRGPLRGIDGFAQILIEDYSDVLDEYGKESLKTIINSCAKMNELMDDILGYSGMAKLDRLDENQNVNKICDSIIADNNLLNQYPDTLITVQENIPDIYGDRSMIYQLFSNLITNAFKYSSKVKDPKVTIGYEMHGNVPIYFIKDNGIGFNQDYATKIFGVFTRLVRDEYKGTGVGLAIAQRVVLKHNGSIWANGELGKGAIFKFKFEQ